MKRVGSNEERWKRFKHLRAQRYEHTERAPMRMQVAALLAWSAQSSLSAAADLELASHAGEGLPPQPPPPGRLQRVQDLNHQY